MLRQVPPHGLDIAEIETRVVLCMSDIGWGTCLSIPVRPGTLRDTCKFTRFPQHARADLAGPRAGSRLSTRPGAQLFGRVVMTRDGDCDDDGVYDGDDKHGVGNPALVLVASGFGLAST